ncbi:MAG TPA: hypothetical protein VFM70_11420 [Salinimicrobium sp.]|nr:hypothetical protein [Salinimicrobium sp.]
MAKKYLRKNIELDLLVLDKENPRFAELYNGSDKESDIIEYLLYTESANELAQAITDSGEFYEDKPLWVIKDGDKYIVRDGNRRCSAVKALQLPNKYGLNLPRFEVEKLPVLEYFNLPDLERRIRLEHNSNLFKKWGRIAKALEIYRMFTSGNSVESLSEIDSNPKDFIKTATFYHEAVKIQGESFKQLVREGKGKTGKTIVFERMFKERKLCGYNFKRSTSEIIIKDKNLFEAYINAIVPFLIANPDTTSRSIDKNGTYDLLKKLKPFGFPPEKSPSVHTPGTSNSGNSGHSTGGSGSQDSTANTPTSSQNSSGNSSGRTNDGSNNSANTSNSSSNGSSNSGTRHSVKQKPVLKRKQIPGPLKKLIDECYNLDQNNFANAKTALTRVSFECTLKFVIENTNKPNGKPFKTSNHFSSAYTNKGKPLPYTNFENLKSKFTELITDTSYRKAFENFDLQNPHQIIHNYRVAAVPANAKTICDNLIDLLEFMLQDETDLKAAIDMAKL